MAASRPAVGMCFARSFPAAAVTEFARALDDGGADELWIIEDCFFTAAPALTSAALAVTQRLRVGIGIMPAVARNAAITAMEIATLEALAPGRLIPGLGHGVQSWMGQIGSRPKSPLTALDEVITVVTRLLAGERVTFHGQYVHLDEVELDAPPVSPPPLLAGVRGPKSLALAGRVSGGVVLADPAGPAVVASALRHCAASDPDFQVVAFSQIGIADERIQAYRQMAPWLADRLRTPSPEIELLPFYDELQAQFAATGVDGLVGLPPQWWSEIGPIGTMDDALAHLHALAEAGATSIALFPSPDVTVARQQLSQVLTLAREFS